MIAVSVCEGVCRFECTVHVNVQKIVTMIIYMFENTCTKVTGNYFVNVQKFSYLI